MSAAELKSLVKSLHGASTDEDTIAVLKQLQQQNKITEAILRESKAGLAVGKLRSHATKDVAELAKAIVKKWKQDVDREKHPNGKLSAAGRKNSVASSTGTPSTPVSMTPTSSSNNGSGNNAGNSAGVRSTTADGVSTAVTGDKTRDKCIELLYNALASDSGAPSELIMSRAKAIENIVRQDNGGTTAAYKSKIRSFFVNLKDKNNPGLRESVVSGDLPIQRFCRMTSQEMASEERKAADRQIMEENLFKALGAEEVQAETDAFQCGRCKQRKCRYRQAQTRSADEPMTTFVTCTVCNNRWKFS
ncbi:transcription elongation factor [Wolfiporia cocos MD-104 SS10]|uniref:Transcription elongation factor n=1 Tax=Wolfiporia cocos (strain MD-104) TaxID=742152 RepID=A0A2H3IYJ3_WOLCO|nr:transcription elongation factor [Wolfiporia cocos MD-104 SS10]